MTMIMNGNSMEILRAAADNFSKEDQLNIDLLDHVVYLMNNGTGDVQKEADRILCAFKDHPESWTKVDAILQFAKLSHSKYFALQILDGVIQTKWKVLPTEQREGIKSFVVEMMLKISENNPTGDDERLFLHKLDIVLVQIVKQEWPKNWPTFISDLVSSAKESEGKCINNMKILSLLSEEVFDFGAQNLTQTKEKKLKQQLCGQMQEVFTLCHTILENASDTAMVGTTLKALHRFLSWIPLGYVFETTVTQRLMAFLKFGQYRNVTLQCLTEIASIRFDSEEPIYKEKIAEMFITTMEEVKATLSDSLDQLAELYKQGSDDEQKYVSCLAQFLVAMLREHPDVVEHDGQKFRDMHDFAMRTLLEISRVEEVEIFKVCLDYWGWVTSELYRLSPFSHSEFSFMRMRIDQDIHPRKKLYSPYLSILRGIMISRMAKPEEVLVVENDQGEVVREMVKDTDSITLYKNMKECLVYLTHLDYKDTEMKMTDKLTAQVSGGEFSWKSLNTLCWAVGSISGTMAEDDEKRFLVLVIRDLLGLCEMKRGKDNKAVIASNIMYVVGQYPRFLRAHWKFLKTVINKLFEFMHETHEGVQDMACDTFIKIAIKCKRHFVVLQLSEQQPFVNDMLQNLNSHICDLTPPQVHVFYEAMGHIISSQSDAAILDDLIQQLMQLPNSVWKDIISSATENVAVLGDMEVIRNLSNIIKTNVAACKSIGAPFMSQLSKIYSDILPLYQIFSENLSKEVESVQAMAGEGPETLEKRREEKLKTPLMKQVRGVKRDILILLSTWVSKSTEQQGETIATEVIPQLFPSVLYDYQQNLAATREPKVLSFLSIAVTTLGTKIQDQVPTILDAVFHCTLDMINKDMEAFPEHRTNFFLLLSSLTQECFPAVFSLGDDMLKSFIDAVIWAFQHSMRNVAEIGLDILKDFLQHVAKVQGDSAQQFYKQHFINVLDHVLAVIADRSQVHVAGLTYYAEILCTLFQSAETYIQIPLSDDPTMQNLEFLRNHIGTLFQQHFCNLNRDQIVVIVNGFISFDNDVSAMRNHLRDFLVQIKEFHGEDADDLFLEERQNEIEVAQKRKSAVPGMVNPHNIEDEDMTV